jgi:hypothetical protein
MNLLMYQLKFPDLKKTIEDYMESGLGPDLFQAFRSLKEDGDSPQYYLGKKFY